MSVSPEVRRQFARMASFDSWTELMCAAYDMVCSGVADEEIAYESLRAWGLPDHIATAVVTRGMELRYG